LEAGIRILEREKPDLMYLSLSDYIQHKYAPGSKEGIVTWTGLLFTFLAILVALLDVRLAGNRVQGLELLIQGLSGKFVSSISALLAATVYLLAEKPLGLSPPRIATSWNRNGLP
jgi:hypothetical protein